MQTYIQKHTHTGLRVNCEDKCLTMTLNMSAQGSKSDSSKNIFCFHGICAASAAAGLAAAKASASLRVSQALQSSLLHCLTWTSKLQILFTWSHWWKQLRKSKTDLQLFVFQFAVIHYVASLTMWSTMTHCVNRCISEKLTVLYSSLTYIHDHIWPNHWERCRSL